MGKTRGREARWLQSLGVWGWGGWEATIVGIAPKPKKYVKKNPKKEEEEEEEWWEKIVPKTILAFAKEEDKHKREMLACEL